MLSNRQRHALPAWAEPARRTIRHGRGAFRYTSRILFENACGVLRRNMTTAIYTHPDCKRHEMGSWHPECPERLQAIEDQLIASRIDGFLDYREAPAGDLTDIGRVHRASAI